MLVRPEDKVWHQFHVNIHIRTLQTKIRIFNSMAYGKIRTYVEYCSSNVYIEIILYIYIFGPKHAKWDNFNIDIQSRTLQTKIRIFNIAAYRKIGTSLGYHTSNACTKMKSIYL